MKNNLVLCIGLILFSGLSLIAQDNSGNNEPSKFNFNFSERFRLVMWDNAIDLNDAGPSNQNFARVRTTLGTQYKACERLEFNLKLTNEFRKYFTPSTADFHLNEIIIDQLNLRYRTDAFIPGVLTIGRQNIFLGEGFVVLDGHPGDGSRSAYFNALRYDWNINSKHMLTGFFAYQPEEDFLPVINGKDIDPAFQGDDSYQLIEQSEKTAALFYNGNFNDINIQSYAIWKGIIGDGKKIVPESNIYTLGARIKLPISEQFNFTSEAAYQIGDVGDYDRSAYGGYAYLTYLLKIEKYFVPRTVNVGAFILSGDDTSTPDLEAWDPLFSRWPKWSESYIYTSLKENQGRVAYWSNMGAIYLQSNLNFGSGVGLDLNYYQLFTMEETAATSFLSGNGTDRGSLIIGKMNYKISDTITGHILWEHFTPGDFYFNRADGYDWARMEFFYNI
ncbi:MAG: alginate export family protein [Bacteroidetes bacterium]|nr:alginate export family protein [Bacteroidota bacterium]